MATRRQIIPPPLSAKNFDRRLFRRRGNLIVLSAASGAGKSTLAKGLLRRRKNLVASISMTTRQPRPGERDGRDYFFVTEPAFHAMRRRQELVEWAEVHGQLYGTPKQFLERMRDSGKDVLLVIDVQGAIQVQRKYPESVLIFVSTPRFADLERRLRERRSEPESEIRRRLMNARWELRFRPFYDYEIVNDRVPDAVRKLDAILTAEALRISTKP